MTDSIKVSLGDGTTSVSLGTVAPRSVSLGQEVGARGPVGPQGAPSSVPGPVGPKGDKGDRGDQGPPGSGSGSSSVSELGLQNLPALVTLHDGDLACSTALISTPRVDTVISVLVNGMDVAGAYYFSIDGGATVLPRAEIAVGATLHWLGSVATWQLDELDRITINYLRAP
jgi:hypothetical protein